METTSAHPYFAIALRARDLYMASCSRRFAVGFNQLPHADRAAWFELAEIMLANEGGAA